MSGRRPPAAALAACRRSHEPSCASPRGGPGSRLRGGRRCSGSSHRGRGPGPSRPSGRARPSRDARRRRTAGGRRNRKDEQDEPQEMEEAEADEGEAVAVAVRVGNPRCREAGRVGRPARPARSGPGCRGPRGSCWRSACESSSRDVDRPAGLNAGSCQRSSVPGCEANVCALRRSDGPCAGAG